ncbi:crotonase/enoyl-CoA hydratase family protein [Streptomyces glomeratus]|uniref:Crotonase/enoyl-CoA hydratase family protein n=1 Tax=Streptomyces glomeratus TaxID=284452 RepID=A0ABP6LKL9_9ACTN|nr:crotonase/enoyl-CoA hydratase family protein [Streptomyces glomeratus]MCF1508683.1 crotonase/enoyl-CoA hydratase family protein [Streptomyces glomeratus]
MPTTGAHRSTDDAGRSEKVLVRRDGPILLITVNRPEKANAFDAEVIAGLSTAYATLSDDPDLRVGVVHAEGRHFTGGLDLVSLAPRLAAGDTTIIPEGGRDPWGIWGEPATKPVVVAVHGRCFTAGLELVLNADLCVAADDAVFAQQEVSRGIIALGGATRRLPQRLGWGQAMRYLLTGDQFDAADALRLGLVQDVVPAGRQLQRAVALARRIAEQAPLAVQATLADARAAFAEPSAESAERLREAGRRLLASGDAREGISALIERRAPVFTGA